MISCRFSRFALMPPLVMTGPAVAQAPTTIPSRGQGGRIRRPGRTYRVELETGLVTFTDGGNVIRLRQSRLSPNPRQPPELTGLALRINRLFVEKIGNRPEIANQLIFAIDVTPPKRAGSGAERQTS